MSFESLLGTGPHAIDGGLASELEARGHALNDSLWSARILADAPDEIRAVHEAYIAAGAEVIVTASYQVSRDGFVAAGRSAAEADEALRRSVQVARSAAEGSSTLVAASVGPYGAILHDGSEYRGRYGVSRERLVEFHAERLTILAAEGPDLLAIETIPDVDEIDALVEALRVVPTLPAWLTVTCADGGHTSAGQPLADVAAAVSSSAQVRAVGVNCTAPGNVADALAALASAGDLPLVAYPNAGGDWDPQTGWQGAGDGVATDLLDEWLAEPRLALVGGCCGVGPATVAHIAAKVG